MKSNYVDALRRCVNSIALLEATRGPAVKPFLDSARREFVDHSWKLLNENSKKRKEVARERLLELAAEVSARIPADVKL